MKSSKKEILREGVAIVRRTKVRKGKTIKDEETQKKLKVRVFVTNPAEVEVRLGHKQGLPNYSSDNAEVTVRMPCYAEEIETVMQETLDYVHEVLEEIVEE